MHNPQSLAYFLHQTFPAHNEPIQHMEKMKIPLYAVPQHIHTYEGRTPCTAVSANSKHLFQRYILSNGGRHLEDYDFAPIFPVNFRILRISLHKLCFSFVSCALYIRKYSFAISFLFSSSSANFISIDFCFVASNVL